MTFRRRDFLKLRVLPRYREDCRDSAQRRQRKHLRSRTLGNASILTSPTRMRSWCRFILARERQSRDQAGCREGAASGRSRLLAPVWHVRSDSADAYGLHIVDREIRRTLWQASVASHI